jgi:HSP20 family protein
MCSTCFHSRLCDYMLTIKMLTIKGKKKKAEEVKEENYYRSERSYGSFVRTSGLPKGFPC